VHPDNHLAEDQQIGFIAQEVQQVVPEVVDEGPDGMFSLSYQQLIPFLVEAIKEQQAEIDELRARLTAVGL
jgi:hypothetical protein